MYSCSTSPEKLLKQIKKLEKIRKNLKENKQRVIDIDIIDFKGFISVNKIELPHPRMHLRRLY